MAASFPASARIVIIGGGVIGTSVAFHLTRSGEKDVVLLEKAALTEGATWHAAGLVGQFRSQQNLMSLMSDSVKLFDTLAEETGQDPGWRKVGSLRLAQSEDRWKELLRSESAARAAGFEMNLLTPAEARGMYPLIETDDLVGAAFIPEDGYIDPNSLSQAYAKGTRAKGGRIFEGVMVEELPREGDRITHVVTDRGTIEVETVVNAAGLWARQVGWMAGVEIPAAVVEHQYFVTEKTDRIPDRLPALRDPDGGFYAKPEPGALAIGGWEKQTRAVGPKEGFPWPCERHLFEDDMDRLEEVFEPAARRLPILSELGVRSIVNGPIPISPDGEPVMGPVPGLSNFFAAFLRRLRVHFRNRRVGWGREGGRELDSPWRCRARSVAVRYPPFWPFTRRPALPARPGARELQQVLRDPLAGRGVGDRARPAPQSALSNSEGSGRRVRVEVRLGAGQLVRLRRYPATRRPRVRPSAAGRHRRSRALGGPRGRRFHRSVLVHEIRDRRAPGLRVPAISRGG